MTIRRSFLKSLAVGAAAPLAAGAAAPANAAVLAPSVAAGARWQRPSHYYDQSAADPLVKQNQFIAKAPDFAVPPTFAAARAMLPKPFWDGHESAVAGYWKAWELAFKNCHPVTRENGFVAPFIDAAFNGCLFMWDSVFMLMFARYGERAFQFQRTLDNFYAKQHADGFICREIRQSTGEDVFAKADPNSTGPNLLPWSEWEYYQQYGDKTRLAAVFAPLLAYYHWFRKNRTWQDGSYWSTGWGCGMDNQPRLSKAAHHAWDHDHLSWVDTTAQAVFSAKILIKMAGVLGRTSDVADLGGEVTGLTTLLNQHMWDERQGFYVDRRRDGSRSRVKSIAGYWSVVAGVAPRARRQRLFAHLTNPATFGRPHPIPTLAADDPHYAGDKGGYWLGGVWPSTNYMVLRALTSSDEDRLAHALGLRHHTMVTDVFETTGTYWENYSPEKAAPGDPAKKDFVGWGGVGPIAVLLEYVLGLRPDYARDVLVWDVRRTEAHGVRDYPLGKDTLIDLAVAARSTPTAAPVVSITASRALRIELRWEGGTRLLNIAATARAY